MLHNLNTEENMKNITITIALCLFLNACVTDTRKADLILDAGEADAGEVDAGEADAGGIIIIDIPKADAGEADAGKN